MRHSLLAAASVLAILTAPSLALAQEQGGEIRVGQRVSGETTEQGRDYLLTLGAGEGFEAIMRSDDIDSVLELYGPDSDGEALARDDDGLNDGLNSRLRFVAPAAGQYRLRALALVEEGPFELSVQRWRPAAFRSTNLTLGRSVSSALNNRSPEDADGQRFQQFRIDLAAGQRISIRAESDDFDTVASIGNENFGMFEELARNDDGPDMGLNSLLNFSAPKAGTYAIRVASVSEGAGRFTLVAQEAEPLAEPIAFVIGESVEGRLNDKTPVGLGDVRADRYALQAEAGKAYEISVVSNDFDSYLAVYDAEGQEVASDDDSGGELNASTVFVPSVSGTYVVEARGLSNIEGAYTLSIEEVAAPPAPVELNIGQEVEGELTDDDARLSGSQRYDAYRFTGTEGQRLQITLISSEFDAVLEVSKADGSFSAIATDDDGMGQGTDSRLMFDVPADGDYIVRAQSFGEGRGSYELRLTDRGPEPKPGSLLIGSTVRGSLSENDNTTTDGPMSSGGYYDDYVFNARKDEKLRFILVAPKFDAVVMVGQATGSGHNWMKQDDDGLSDTHSRLIWTAPRDGEYVVRVTSFGANSTGDYSLIVERQP
ncbi:MULTISPECIES: PPC domain-containing protein [unclassified Brevundimonas]|uniref:PPC domain-containing protein n=1 Tax=unclassified Brevundimonas TaxID=2622653 RepID=UPI0025BBC40B|nr:MULTISPECIES: PPC domain-containing protein [unclassified Brevundimonas]